jgi:hypothetical protein
MSAGPKDQDSTHGSQRDRADDTTLVPASPLGRPRPEPEGEGAGQGSWGGSSCFSLRGTAKREGVPMAGAPRPSEEVTHPENAASGSWPLTPSRLGRSGLPPATGAPPPPPPPPPPTGPSASQPCSCRLPPHKWHLTSWHREPPRPAL